MILKSAIFLLWTLSFVLLSCSGIKFASTNQRSDYTKIAEQKFGIDTAFKTSPDGRFVLCFKTDSQDNLNPNVSKEFFVFDTEKQQMIYSDTIANVKLSWYSNVELLIKKQKGTISSLEDSGRTETIVNMNTLKAGELKKPKKRH